MAEFVETFDSLRDVKGWMTKDQAHRLWNRAKDLRAGDRVVEIGSFQGRSMCVLATAATSGVELIAIDPHGGNDRGPQEISGFAEEAQGDHEAFNENLARAGVRERVTHLRKFSDDALGDVDGRSPCSTSTEPTDLPRRAPIFASGEPRSATVDAC
jgi:hypothetical protein